jgi:hypothetical protein
MLRSATKLLKNVTIRASNIRTLSHYPIDDALFGLTEEQSAVSREFLIL